MNKIIKVLTLVLALVFVLGFTAFADEEELKAEAYLAEYYGVTVADDVTLESINAALTAVGAEPVETEKDFVIALCKIAGCEELALSYIHDDAPDKAAKVLEDEGTQLTEDEAVYAPYAACLLDMDVIDDDDDSFAEVLYKALEIGGKGRHYIGRVEDDDILSVLNAQLNTFINFDNEQLTNLGTEIVLRGATTGYNLKYAGYDANFLSDYTLQYGHSDYTHAVQLIALMESEGFDAYIQIEPKVSVYEYMIEWGEPGEPTPTYAVKQVAEDRYLAYAMEYDMKLEFDSIEEKEAFHSLIETYAKKYDESYDADGNLTEKLIAGAWWQPLYSSTTEMQNEEFGLLIDNVVYDASGMYSIHPFSLPDATQAIADVVAEIEPELAVSHVNIHVNPAFMRYITGESHQ